MDYTISRIGQFLIKEFGDSYIITIVITGLILTAYLFAIKARLAGEDQINVKSILIGLLLGLSIAGILNLTLLNRAYSTSRHAWEWIPLWSYYEVIILNNKGLAIEILENILLFIPLGVLLPMAFYQFRTIKYIIITTFSISLIIELMQGVLKLGLFEWDDIINNTLGAVIGNRIWWIGFVICTGMLKRNARNRKAEK